MTSMSKPSVCLSGRQITGPQSDPFSISEFGLIINIFGKSLKEMKETTELVRIGVNCIH
jgi:hypothetical protein